MLRKPLLQGCETDPTISNVEHRVHILQEYIPDYPEWKLILSNNAPNTIARSFPYTAEVIRGWCNVPSLPTIYKGEGGW